MTDAAATAARRAYAAESTATRLHVELRWRTCPFPAIAGLVPRRGRVLDAGCGHGLLSLYLASQVRERHVTGVDIDEGKLAIARRAAHAAGLEDRVTFTLVDADWLPDAPWDAIVEVDMLYLLGRARASAWVGAAAAALAPDGELVVKELDVVPAWKARWSRFQEVVATRVLRITEGEELELVPSAAVRAAMLDAGLAVDTRRLDRGRLHPHYVAVGAHS